MCSARTRMLWIRHVCLPQQGCGWRGRSLGVLDATLERSSGLLKRPPKGQGYATRHARPCNACPIRSRSPLKAASLIFQGAMAMLHDGPTSVGRWRLGRGLARRHFFCSIRSRYDQGHQSRPPSARMGTPRTRGEMRPCPNRNSPPPWHELSLWHAIEMQPSFHHASTPACTHARPVTPSLGAHSQRTVTHQRRRLAQHLVGTGALHCCHLRPPRARSHVLGTNPPPTVYRNFLPGT